jgi:gas vesicle structural protein
MAKFFPTRNARCRPTLASTENYAVGAQLVRVAATCTICDFRCLNGPAGKGELRSVLERVAGNSSLIEVLDRVLDRGVVIDAWVRVSLVGIDLITVEARVVVASIATYLQFSEVVGTFSSSASASSAASPAPLLAGVTTPNGAGRPGRKEAVA